MNNNYDFDPEQVQATILRDNYSQAVIACEVERRVAKTYQNIALALIGGVLALIGFGGGALLLSVTSAPPQPTTINIKQPS